MGLSPFGSKSCGLKPEGAATPMPAPNPANFRIVRQALIEGRGLVMEVHYPDCTNYEGRKVLLYVCKSHRRYDEITLSRTLDPHFSKSVPSPVARFEPTDYGWSLACKAAMFL